MKRWAFSAIAGLAMAAWAQAPLNINGVSDKAYYTGTVTLSVPSTNGYIYRVQLDGVPIPTDGDIVVNQVDYHELAVTRTNTTTGAVTNRLIRFIVRSTDRGDTEDGLTRWVPYPVINSTAAELAGAHLEIIAPESFPAGMEVPVVAWIKNDQGNVVRANGLLTAEGHPAIQLRRGVGSGFLAATNPPGVLSYAPQLPGIQTNKSITLENAPAWTSVSGTLATDTIWDPNSRIAVTGSLTIPANITLTIYNGTVVRLAGGVNITNNGRILIQGLPNRPVVFTPVTRSQPWGGIFMMTSTAQMDAVGAIFVASGAAQSGYPGHRNEQPLFFLDYQARAALTNCATIYLAGQFFHSNSRTPYATFTMVDSLIQRCTTGGEFNGCSLTFLRSALIEVPFDDDEYGTEIDSDFDGFYLNTGVHELRDSLLGWVKDDCMDSGSGGGPTTVTVTNCWIEGSYHEGCAWSGGNRTITNLHLVVINCGQGIEAGWSRDSGITPNVFASDCLSLANGIGARFGDNYNWDYYGLLRLTNSIVLNNHRDVWGMNWRNWLYGISTRDGTFNMDVQGNLISQANTNHPNNNLWNPTTDSWRLANWMTTPPEAAVGIGLAGWTNRFALSSLFNGVPVRLSSFTTNVVSVAYTFETTNGTLAGDILTFAPGETVKKIYPAGFNMATQSQVQVGLRNPVGGELTGQTNVTFVGSVAAPQVSLVVITNLYPTWRLTEGVFATLTAPSSLSVSLNYQFENSTGVVANGTLVFNPVEIRRQIFLDGANPFDFDQLRLTVSNPTNAILTGTTTVTYTNPPLTMSLAAGTNYIRLEDFTNGISVILNAPAPTGVSVAYTIAGNRDGLTNGTLSFANGEMAKSIFAPTVSATQNDFIKVTLSNPVRAAFAGPTTVYYVRLPAGTTSSPVTLVYRGSRSIWRYNDTGVYPGADWMTTNFNDSAWPSGGATLGYNDNNIPMTTTNSYGPNASSKFISYYFRHYFNVTNATGFSNITFNLLRDDGAVVYWNGTNVYRENMPATVTHTTTATTNVGGTPSIYRLTTVAATTLPIREGTNVVAVEVHQNNGGSGDMVFDLEIIGTPLPPPPTPQPVYYGRFDGQYTLAWGDATFRLLEATNLAGPWTTNPATGIFSTAPTNTQSYFRLRKP